jgi:hypothetical protein
MDVDVEEADLTYEAVRRHNAVMPAGRMLANRHSSVPVAVGVLSLQTCLSDDPTIIRRSFSLLRAFVSGKRSSRFRFQVLRTCAAHVVVRRGLRIRGQLFVPSSLLPYYRQDYMFVVFENIHDHCLLVRCSSRRESKVLRTS